MNARGQEEGIDAFSIVDEFSGFRVSFRHSRPARLSRFGVETASNSEGGLERTYQGTCIVSQFPVVLSGGGEYHIETAMTVLPVGEK